MDWINIAVGISALFSIIVSLTVVVIFLRGRPSSVQFQQPVMVKLQEQFADKRETQESIQSLESQIRDLNKLHVVDRDRLRQDIKGDISQLRLELKQDGVERVQNIVNQLASTNERLDTLSVRLGETIGELKRIKST